MADVQSDRRRRHQETVLSVVKELLVTLAWVVYYWLEAIVRAILPVSIQGKDVSGETVLITGAGSGIGRLMAIRFAKLKCRLVLWDVNKEGNEETASMVRSLGATAKSYQIDLCDRDAVYSLAKQVKQDVGEVDILINNAGIVTGKKYLQCPDSLICKTMEVNSMAHFWTVKAFLPSMLDRDHGHIVNIASGAGLFGITGLADYCASKFAAVGFDESLRFELQSLGKFGVHTTVVCPYFINTGMFDGVKTRFPWLLPILESEDATNRIISAVLCNQHLLIMPRICYVLYALKGILPVKCVKTLGDFVGVFNSMDDFRGREKKSN